MTPYDYRNKRQPLQTFPEYSHMHPYAHLKLRQVNGYGDNPLDLDYHETTRLVAESIGYEPEQLTDLIEKLVAKKPVTIEEAVVMADMFAGLLEDTDSRRFNEMLQAVQQARRALKETNHGR